MSEKGYQPHLIENEFYRIWEARGYFEPEGNRAIQKKDKRFCVMMPPPNVTGSLHIGHALTFTLQDIMVRYKRMDGYKTLWQPGTDHAGIATQNVVEKQLLAEGKTKEDLGREAFLKRVWSWKAQSGGMIVHQMRRLGVSPAWSRERFTMDEGLKHAVRKAFKELYDTGLIVRGNYMVNWCTHDGALSDIEVEYEEHEGKLYHIRYPLSDGSGHVVVATTRPETYFGDTAVMVHPDDGRYAHLIGKTVTLPLIEREITIITDEHVDREFGTGVVKVTPAHDPNDYEVGKRHDLEFITIFDEKGILNRHCGEFEGHERLDARERIVEKLRAEGFIKAIEPHRHQVGHCYRCHNVVEPYISRQWFVKKEIAARAIERVNAGEATFFPPHWINSYNAWMGELRDWCISRQLWWGHRIPVFTCASCDHEWTDENASPTACPQCGSASINQDPDVLDTWFSSALWPFSTLGWGNGGRLENEFYKSGDIETFYPNSLLITGFDILFFWVARMIMMGEHFMGNLPFADIYLHALVRDEHGNKMSKSRGNVIDPLDTIEQYSADALRFTLAMLAVQGRDIKLSADKLDQSRNFTNKLYNAANYLLLQQERFNDLDARNIVTPLGRYMLSRFNLAVSEVRRFIDQYRFNDAATTLYRFLWGEFCDWGIELSKASKESAAELGAIFKEAMKLLHPFMPFISEYLYHRLSKTSLEDGESIMIAPYPETREQDEAIEATFAQIIEAIVAIRRVKATVDIPGKSVAKTYINAKNPMDEALCKPFIRHLAKSEEVIWCGEKIDGAIADIAQGMEIYLPLDTVDLEPILQRLQKQQEKLTKEVVKLSSMLHNEKFIAKAPETVVAQNRGQLEEVSQKLAQVEAELLKLASL